MTLESDTVIAVGAYTYLTVQTSTQAGTTPATNTSANLLYNTSSRRQGNWSTFYAMALLQVAKDEAIYSVTLTDAYKAMAYAYYIQYLYERKSKDWNASSLSSGGDSVNRPGSGALQAYKEVLDGFKTVDATIERHTDYTNYPDKWKNTQMDFEEIDIET